MSKKILLEFNEDLFNDFVKRQDAAAASIEPLKKYCEDTLQIEVTNLKTFCADPKKYCVDAYWEKYGQQFQNSPVQKEKLLTLTAWNEATADSHISNMRRAFGAAGSNNIIISETEVSFERDPERFKKYVNEEDLDLYDELTDFIEKANQLQEKGGKPAWTLAKFHPGLAAPNNELIHSKIYFSSTPEARKRGIGHFFS